MSKNEIKYAIFLYIMMQDKYSNKEEKFLYACRDGDIDLVKTLITEIDPSFNHNFPIGIAAANGHLAVVEYLLTDPRVNPCDWYNWAIKAASQRGHFEIVKLLLSDPRVNPGEYDNYPIRFAVEYGHIEILALLLADSRANPADNNNYAIKFAAEHGCLEIVEMLLADPRVDLSNWDDIIMETSDNGFTAVAELLIQHQYQLDKSKYLEMAKLNV